ncbi:MAG: protein kinase [Pirellulaceae bacterium]|nr:protein kinase [Pirellulaceae bacterium]
MAEVKCCPQCGCDVSPDSPAGLCPDCLLGAGLGLSEFPPEDPPLTEARNTVGFVPPKPHELADRFPQFEILDLLGYGGMGAVYKARQKSLDRLVALKIIKPDAADDPGFAERFAREAKALARLNHANIVSIHDFGKTADSPHSARDWDPADDSGQRFPGSLETFGQESGSVGDRPQRRGDRPQQDGDRPQLYYFVMEYVDGTNLRRLLETKELPPHQAIQIIPQVCEALQFAHDERIVHRDIKPENILVDSRGRVKIADFGLAKLLGKTSVEDHTLTGTHQVMGTPRYMAPEQMEGSRSVDHRADIYSLGVVFYEMLTGELPMGSFEPPSKKVQVDVRLDEVVLRSLAKEPERRYQHASEVKTDVESISASGVSLHTVATDYREQQVGSLTTSSTDDKKAKEDSLLTAVMLILFTGSVAGISSMFTPWSQVHIESLAEASQYGLEAGSEHSLKAQGYRYALPILGAMLSLALFAFTLAKTIIGEFPSAPRAMLAAATGITLAMTARLIFCLAPLPNMPDEYSSVLRGVGHHFTDSGYSMRELQNLEVRGSIDLRVEMGKPGCYMAMLFGVALVVASVLEMRAVLALQLDRFSGDASELMRGPATALRWAAWSSPLTIPVLIGMNIGYSSDHSSVSTVLLVVMVLQILHTLFVVPLILIGVARMQSFDSRGWGKAASIASMLPLGLTFVVGIPAGIWSLIVLARPEVIRDSRKRTVNRDVSELQFRRAGIGLFITALISLIFWIGMAGTTLLLLILQVDRVDGITPDLAVATILLAALPIPVILGAIHVSSTVKLLRFESHAWAIAAGVIALIPFSPAWIVGLPLGIWTLNLLLKPEVKDAFSVRKRQSEKPKPIDPDHPPVDWSTMFLGLCVILPLLALIAFGMWFTGSAWVLAALALPWFGLGMAGVATDGTPKEKTVTTLAVVSFLLSLGLIAFTIWIEHSAWPLAGLAVGFVAALAGMGLAAIGEASEEETDGSKEQEEEEGEEEEEEEEESPKETLEGAAWWVGAVGVFRCWHLLSESNWSDMIDGLSLGQFDSIRGLVLGLSGPVILIAAIAMHHARFYWLALTACVLCLLSGSWLSVLIGIWTLIALFDPRLRALFLANEQALSITGAVGTDLSKPTKSPLPRGYGDAIGSTLGNAWTDWWRERDSLFTRSVQTVLMLMHIGCLLAFLGFSVMGSTNDQGAHEIKHRIGYPSPWYTQESTSQSDGSFSESNGIRWSSSAWLVAACGLGLAYIYWRIEKIRNPDAGFWHKPKTIMLAWVVLAIADIGLGAGMGQLGVNFQPLRDSYAIEQISSSNAPGNKTAAGETDPQVAALMRAATTGQIGAIRRLLAEGVDVNDKDADGRTALMTASTEGQVSTALALIVMGANPNEKDNEGLTALMYAAAARQTDLIAALFQLELAARNARARDASPDEAAMKFKQTAGVSVQILEEFGDRAINLDIDENAQDARGETALMKAAIGGDLTCIDALMKEINGFAINGGIQDKLGLTWLMHLAINGHTEVLRTLIEDKDWPVSINGVAYVRNRMLDPSHVVLTDAAGKNVIQLAEERGHGEIAELLRKEMRRWLEDSPDVVKRYATEALTTGDNQGSESKD